MAKWAYTQQKFCQSLALPVVSLTKKQADEGQEIADVMRCICLGEELCSDAILQGFTEPKNGQKTGKNHMYALPGSSDLPVGSRP